MDLREMYDIPENLTLEKVLELFYANDKRAAESKAEYDRKREEEKAEHDRKQAEWEQKQAEWDRKWAKTMEAWEKADRRIDAENKKLGGIENTFGEIVEHLVAPGIEERFRELGLEFELVGRDICLNEGKRCLAEIDLLLFNGESIMAVEVKSKPHLKDIPKHEERLAKLRGYYDRHGDRRRILGAMAGAVFGKEEREAALDAGLFVIVQSGDTMRMDIPEGFKPKAW
ncbi:MAG: hypothetical protein FWD94_04400 [Treponema sp.]|nr:hypothetical protein [Treponema sp.]